MLQKVFSLLWPPYVIGQGRPLYFCPVVSSSSIFLFSSPNLCRPRLDVYHTWCGLSANLGCRSETCCTRLAENTGCKKWPQIPHLGTITQLCRAVSLQLRHVSTIGKNLLNSSTSPICTYNMLNCGPLAGEIGLPVWGTSAHFNGFRVGLLAALLHGTGRQPNFAALDRGRHLYLSGRPSRWALAHILVDITTSPTAGVQVLR